MVGGSFTNDPGATYTISNDNGISGSGATFYNSGTFKKSAGNGASTITPSFTNNATLEVASGTLNFSQALTQTGGTTLLDGNNLGVTGEFLLQAGLLVGPGKVAATDLRNESVIQMANPGALGTLTIIGDYIQTSTGWLSVRIDGAPGSGSYDKYVISGKAILAGTLSVILVNNYQPGPSLTWQILTWGSLDPDANRFSTTNIPSPLELGPYTSSGLTVFTP